MSGNTTFISSLAQISLTESDKKITLAVYCPTELLPILHVALLNWFLVILYKVQCPDQPAVRRIVSTRTLATAAALADADLIL